MAQAKRTPMMEQWHDFRGRLPDDTLLLFRLGDFYEIFLQDAEEGARILGITLTQRHGMPMAGIPYHAANAYIGKILKAGRKVAIVDQVETPKAGKLVKRELTRIITPGTILESQQQEERRSQFILAIELSRKAVHAAWLEISTGEFSLTSQSLDNAEGLLSVFTALDPKEVILPEGSLLQAGPAAAVFVEALDPLLSTRSVTEVEAYHFDSANGYRGLTETLNTLNLDGFGIADSHEGIGSAGALLDYVTKTLCKRPEHLKQIREYRIEDTLLIDPATQRNLEVFKSAMQTREGSLMAAMDATLTAAGSRKLEQFLSTPTLDLEEISTRQRTVGIFTQVPTALYDIQELLKRVRDIPRILSRLQNRLQNPRELGGVRDTLNQLPEIRESLRAVKYELLDSMADRIEEFDALEAHLRSALNDDLPGSIQDGGTIRHGFDEELDYLYGLTSDNKSWLADLEKSEQELTGIKNLKVKYNGAFGYFIEVTKSNLAMVPNHYIRKQTMANAERYTTEDLKRKEKEILNAEERALAREEQLFGGVISRILEDKDRLEKTAHALAELDVFCGWAEIAREWNYCQPVLDESDALEIEGGRHPVVEQMMRKERRGLAGEHRFVPNDCSLQSSQCQIALITGPNMAGKSTFIRQVGLIVLMAQVGAWVPANNCRIGKVDRIFSRVGASDELARGNSTFMVEMNETANILNNCTRQSLIILDEIGRGTSTYDGLSIAWSVVEHLHSDAEAGPRTLFATHYHELTRLSADLSRMENFSVAVKEWNDEIVFVRQVVPGAADRSYGIQVARLAGLPDTVIARAKDILADLESGSERLHALNFDADTSPEKEVRESKVPKKQQRPGPEDFQMELFG